MTPVPEKILIVDDEANMLALCESVLGKEGYVVVCAASAEEALKRLDADNIDLLIADLRLPGMDGMELVQHVKVQQPGLPYLLLTGHGTIQSAVAAMKDGAADYLTKPVDVEELKVVVKKALEVHRLTQEVQHLRLQVASDQEFPEIIGQSKAIRAVLRQVQLIAASDSTVLLQGESGTGKELVARALHRSSPRRERPFITLDCGTIPESLLESELFGYVKGAFTGANSNKKGLWEEAHGGTLFLDEIGDIPLTFQTKLLRVLQEGEIRPVGSTKRIRVDTRIVAASNKDLKQEVRGQHFREDLYYRLAVVPLRIPPLRERREDIPLLVEHFVDKYCTRNHQPQKQVPAAILRQLMEAAWPGNVRELEHTIERAVLLSPGTALEAEGVVLDHVEQDLAHAPTAQAITEAHALLDNVEREKLRQALVQTHNNRVHAAKLLGISRSTLYEKLKRYHLLDELSAVETQLAPCSRNLS
jgi:two-component system, NtrC family, response regulator AtoC